MKNENSFVIQPKLDNEFLKLVAGNGVWVEDARGRSFLDGAAGVGVMSLGYGRDELVDAMSEQASLLPFVHSLRFKNAPQEALAERLSRIAPKGIDSFFFCAGGSEALESSLKLIRQYWISRNETQRVKVIGRKPSFHGNTLGALSVGYHAARREPYAPLLLRTPHIDAPWRLRCKGPHGGSGEAELSRVCSICSGDVLEETILEEGPETVAAFIAEPIIGAAAPGVTPDVGYYERIRDICDRYGILFVCDEVITGIGRTGLDFGISHWSCTPDILMSAKGLGGGYAPLAAVGAQKFILDSLRRFNGQFDHNFTMAGNPVSCAVGAKVLEIVERDGIVGNAAVQGVGLFSRLSEVEREPIVAEVRGKGLLAGIEFGVPDSGAPFSREANIAGLVDAECKAEGLLVYPSRGIIDGDLGDAILIMPPLTSSASEIDILVDRLGRAIRRVQEAVLG